MGRLLLFILVCVIFLGFIIINLDNKSDLSFGIRTFNEIPVFLTAFSSFVLGMIFAVPFVLSFYKKRRNSAESQGSPASAGTKKRWGKKSKKTQQEAGLVIDEPGIKKEDSPYGID